jgi:methyl-accepting chemotaxis protein
MLSKLVPDIRKTAELVREIAASCNEQSVGAAQVNKAMQQLDQVIQQNASASEEIASTSEELSSQAESLQSVISFFRLGNGARGQGQQGRMRRSAAPKVRVAKPSSREQLSSLGSAVRAEGVTLSLANVGAAVDQQDRDFESY